MKKLTHAAKITDFKREWFLVDAENVVVGKLATQVAKILRGKTKTSFSPHVDCGDYVVVINAEKVALTRNKMETKIYRKHTGWWGHLQEVPAKTVMERQPTRMVRDAIYGMLPKNKLRDHFMKKLFIYAGPEHKHTGQNPTPIKIS